MTELLIDVEVTRYSVVDNKLVETTKTEQTSAYIQRDYLHLSNCAGSAHVSSLLRDAPAGHEWYAQAGTKPAYVDPCANYIEAGSRPCGESCCCGPADCRGGWGGRNYPQIVVSADEVLRALEALT